MKTPILLLAAALFVTASIPVPAQIGKSSNSAADSALTKVFGTKLNFSATMDMQVKTLPMNDEISMSSKIYFAQGNSRTEMDMTKMTGTKMPPHAVDQMKSMGMDQMVTISRNDTKTVYMIYPGLEAYAKMASPDANQTQSDTKVETVELGKETLDGHPCVKKQFTVTNTKTAEKIVMLAWTATDLKDYPIKIEINSNDEGKGKKVPTTTTLHFVDIDTAQPAASLFEPPVGYRVYTDVQALMQTEMMKKMQKMQGLDGLPPGHP